MRTPSSFSLSRSERHLLSKSSMFSTDTNLNPYIPCFQSPTTQRLGSFRIIRDIIS